MKIVSNLPDASHTPFPPIAAEPSLQDMVASLRVSDIAMGASTAVGFPFLLWRWELARPSVHPRCLWYNNRYLFLAEGRYIILSVRCCIYCSDSSVLLMLNSKTALLIQAISKSDVCTSLLLWCLRGSIFLTRSTFPFLGMAGECC